MTAEDYDISWDSYNNTSKSPLEKEEQLLLDLEKNDPK